MTLPLPSKPKIAIFAALIYTAIMGFGMFYMKNFRGISYEQPEMTTVFWFVLLVLNAINVFFVIRYFGWQEIGFRQLKPKQLLWFVPSISVLLAMWAIVLLVGFPSTPLDAAQWRLLALVGFTTFLVGVGEEVMYRGIVLHAFLTTKRVLWAMLASAIGFAILHSINVFGGLPLIGMIGQLILTFLLGFLFAPLAIKLNNLWPLIIFHWLWDFVLFSAPIVGNPNLTSLVFIHVLIEIIVGTLLWLRINKERDVILRRVGT